MRAITGIESAFDAPFLLTHSSRRYCHERAGWGRQNWLCRRVRETLGAPLEVTTTCCAPN